MDIYEKIEKYSDLGVGINLIQLQKQDAIDQVLTPEIKEKLAEIEAEYFAKAEELKLKKDSLESEIKQEVLQAGRTVKGTNHQFIYLKPRVTWNVPALDGYAEAHPEIRKFRTEGNPSVSVRKA